MRAAIEPVSLEDVPAATALRMSASDPGAGVHAHVPRRRARGQLDVAAHVERLDAGERAHPQPHASLGHSRVGDRVLLDRAGDRVGAAAQRQVARERGPADPRAARPRRREDGRDEPEPRPRSHGELQPRIVDLRQG